MTRAALAMMVLAGEALAHPGHGAPEGHFHAHAAGYLAGIVVVLLILVYALNRK